MTASCDEIRLSLGLYTLGALDPEEIPLVEAHLAECAACRAERDELAGLPALLSRVSESDIARVTAPPRAVLDRVSRARDRRRRGVRLTLVAASVAVLVSGGGVAAVMLTGGGTAVDGSAAAPAQSQAEADGQDLLAGPKTTAEIAPDTVPDAAADTGLPRRDAPAVPARRPDLDLFEREGAIEARIRVYGEANGSSVEIDLSGVPSGTPCRLIAVGGDGSTEVAARWRMAAGAYTGQLGGIGLTPDRIARFEVIAEPDEVLVTLVAP